MQASEHLDHSAQAATAIKDGVPADNDFGPEKWQEFEQLAKTLEAAIAELHPAAHQAAEAHAAHAGKTAQRVEKRAANIQQTSDAANTAGQAAAQAEQTVGQHEAGSNDHTAALAAHADAKNTHTEAQTAHETAKTRHQDAQQAHENATHHAHHAATNVEHADSLKKLVEEMMAELQQLLQATSQIPHDAEQDHKDQVRQQHQGSIDKIKSHSGNLHEHLNAIQPESLELPEDDSAEDLD
jgi:hypothetical protein